MTWTVRVAGTDDADLLALAGIVNAVTPDDPTSVDHLRWSDATYPGGLRLLAEQAGVAVGAATTGRIHVQPPGYDAWWGTLAVLPESRGQGIGSRLLHEIAAAAAAAGKEALHVPAAEARPDGVDFLVRRGFTVHERFRVLELELAGLAASPVRPPAGIRLTSLAAEPDLVEGVHRVALETFEDIPGGDQPMAVGDLAEFRARDVDRPAIPAGGFVVAVDAARGEVVGYASLLYLPGSTTRAYHDMTAVRRAWRGRGLATALKLATIQWAIDHGLERLETGNDEANAAMQAVNARLGYRPRPDELIMRGDVRRAMMTG